MVFSSAFTKRGSSRITVMEAVKIQVTDASTKNRGKIRSDQQSTINTNSAPTSSKVLPIMIMAARCFTRPRARVFGTLVEGGSIRILARPRPSDKTYVAYSYRNFHPIAIQNTSHSIQPLATSKTILPPIENSSSFPQAADDFLAEELGKAAAVLKSDAVPGENDVQSALHICENLARSLAGPIVSSKTSRKPGKTPTSNLLSLEERSRAPSSPMLPISPLASAIGKQTADKISSVAYNIITDPKNFITPKLLATYIDTLSVLGRPQSFPQIFDLYASKPIPQPKKFPIEYRAVNPNRASSAVALSLAHKALAAAIEVKDLSLCLSIIDTTVCTKAHKRNKFVRHALLPFSGLALAPAAAYVVAAQLAQYQHSMDNQLATNLAFVGILAYVGFTATIGIVAIATANDQMDRITWAMGTPLRERWIREEERAFVDKVAGAWGFQDVNKRGEEEGGEWEALREWALMKGMVLDKPELMFGME